MIATDNPALTWCPVVQTDWHQTFNQITITIIIIIIIIIIIFIPQVVKKPGVKN